MGRRSLALAAVLFVLSLGVAAVAGASQTDLPAWGTEPTPNGGFGPNSFAAVAVVSDGDAWAVGRYEEGSKHPLVEHWNGAAWTLVDAPPVAESELLGVAAVAADDVWMVGGYENTGEALIMHWDGTQISVVPHPNPGTFNRLYAVDAISADDVWAVGEFTNPISRTLALHWDGSTWTQVSTPTGSHGYSHLYGVAAVSSDDVWAVGDDGSYTYSLHWNGSAWKRIATPTPGSYALLRAVSASSDQNVWAVGDGSTGSVTLRWSGGKWNLVPSPDPGTSFIDVNGVAALGADDVWAVGFYDVWGNWKTLAMHWNGTEWSVVDSPSPDPSLNVLYGVAAPSTSLSTRRSVFAVGTSGFAATLALRLKGADWTVLQSDNEGTGANVLNAISVASPDDIWAVGRVGQVQPKSLTLHFDGTQWRIVPSPNGTYGIQLEGVVAIASDDAWAVGWTGSGSDLDDQSVAMHWDGASWSVVPTPQPGGDSVDRLFAIDAAGPNDAWAVGVYWDPQEYQHPVILHWDGTSWKVRRNPCDTLAALTGIAVIAAADVWAVGDATTCHYNGSKWTLVPSPQPRPDYYEIGYPLEDVSGASSTDVWAVGARVTDYGEYLDYAAFAEHWDGVQWQRVVYVPGTFLYGVEAVAADDVWAVGTDSYGPLIVHYDGTEWSTVPTPEWGRGGRLAGIDSAAPGDLWAAGNYFPSSNGSRTLVEHAPSAIEGAVVGATHVSGATVSWFGPETGSTETDDFGDYQIGGLQAGTYTFTATYPGCSPDTAQVTVVAGETIRRDFELGC